MAFVAVVGRRGCTLAFLAWVGPHRWRVDNRGPSQPRTLCTPGKSLAQVERIGPCRWTARSFFLTELRHRQEHAAFSSWFAVWEAQGILIATWPTREAQDRAKAVEPVKLKLLGISLLAAAW